MNEHRSLHPQARAFLDDLAASGTQMPWDAGSAQEARDALLEVMATADRPAPVAQVEDRIVPTNTGAHRVRIFTPEGQGPFPVVLWFHGGGWVVGSIEESDAVCRSMCRRTGAMVICPNYRLAPEHVFPAAAEDCYAVTEWVAQEAVSLGARKGALAVAGDSAGGNLAAVVALMARDRGGPDLVAQLLVYPVLGLPSDGRASYTEFGEGFFLTRMGMEWFTSLYASTAEDLRNPYLSPLLAEDLSGLPPALIITAGCDPLRDEGEAYARRLADAGTACRHRVYEGQIHAFFILPEAFDAAEAAHDEAAQELRRAFASLD
jgi:acetyl esterase